MGGTWIAQGRKNEHKIFLKVKNKLWRPNNTWVGNIKEIRVPLVLLKVHDGIL
jgi:hypothetical protein